jgi:hypothetical protein
VAALQGFCLTRTKAQMARVSKFEPATYERHEYRPKSPWLLIAREPIWDSAFQRAANRTSRGLIYGRNPSFQSILLRGRCEMKKIFAAGVITLAFAPSAVLAQERNRRRSVRRVVGSSHFRTYRRRGRCCGWIHGGSFYCSIMGAKEI